MKTNQNLNIDLNVNDLLNNTVVPPIDRISQTFVSLWNLTFGMIDHQNEKINIKRMLELESFKKTLESKVNDIPKENIKEPDVHITGPALEKSKYFYNEEELRNMFAKLISSNMDNRLTDYIHPSFSSIISEMNSIDAKVLYTINKPETFYKTIANIVFEKKDEPYTHTPHINNFYLPYSSTDQVASASISNLERLGLIKVDYSASFSDKKYYQEYSKSFVFNVVEIEYYNKVQTDEQLSHYIPKLQYGRIFITDFGKNFIKVCLWFFTNNFNNYLFDFF